MSLFFNNVDHLNTDPERIKLAEIQFDAISTTFDTMLRACRQKCIPAEYGEHDLNKGESVCTDRCVSKYMKANLLIGQYAQSKGFAPQDLVVHEKIKKNYCKN